MTDSPMTVAELWRYPVKTLAGERLDRAELTADGVVGDRLVHGRDCVSRSATSFFKSSFFDHLIIRHALGFYLNR